MLSLIAAAFLLAAPSAARDFRPALLATMQYTYNPANEVDVELVLAVDISQSMDTDEQEVQRAGYIAALTSRDFLDAIEVGPIGRVAVAYMEWGGVDEHFIVADWTVIQDETSAAHFASKIAEAPLRQVQRTSIASALKKSPSIWFRTTSTKACARSSTSQATDRTTRAVPSRKCATAWSMRV
ncbi:DUF1194 domain-containing protein [Roseibium salinum]|nr:DUF1194 domain-containing protein [Roseibium salinum]